MITTKIRRLDEDDTEPQKNRGSAADERAAMAALARKSDKSFYYVKTRAKRPGRGGGSGKGISAGRGRHQHKKDAMGGVEYLIEGKEAGAHPDGEGRVEDAFTLDMPTAQDGLVLNASELREAGNWMGESAALNTRIRAAAIQHYVVALRPEEREVATPEFWRSTAQRVREELGMDGHQLICVVHGDTDHPHAHFLLNRVHPTTHKAVSVFQDMYKLEALTRQIEKERGLQEVKGRLIDPKTGEPWTVEQIKAGKRPPKRGPRGGANEFKKRAQAALKETKPFTVSDSWEELEGLLEEKGYHLDQKGGGLVLVETGLPPKNDKGEKQFTELKISAIAGKGLGQQKLEYFFGETWSDYQEAKAQGVSVEELSVQRQAAEQRQADQAATQLRALALEQQRQAEEKRKARRARIDAVKGKAWVIDIANLEGCENIQSERECRDLIEDMTPQERLETYTATKTKLEEMEDGGAPWLELEQVRKTSGRLKQSLAPGQDVTKTSGQAEPQAEPILFDDEGLASHERSPERKQQAQSRLSALHDKFDMMSPDQLRAELDATRQARADKALDNSTPERATRSGLLRGGERVLTNYMTEKRNLPIPVKPSQKVITKSRRGGR
ncbi:relaxase/mobilization nuclease domain-containing protein [Pseudomonadota bacterium]